MTCGIYKISSKETGLEYVGQSINIEKRFRQHKLDLLSGKHHNSHLLNHMESREFSDLLFEIIEECSSDALDDREIFWISELDSYNNGFNQTPGGFTPEIFRKFDEDEIIAIRIIRDKGAPYQYIADLFEVNYSVIHDICSGSTYSEIKGPIAEVTSRKDYSGICQLSPLDELRK